MKNLKKFLAIFLSIAMVMCSTLPSFASETETTVGANEEIVESSEETLVDETSRGERLSEPEEEPEEDETDATVGDDILSSHNDEPEEESEEDETTVAEEESEEDETTAAVEESEEDETTAAVEEESSETAEEETTAPEETSETVESSETVNPASPSELIEISAEANDKLLGATPTPWMYWYLTDEDGDTILETIRFSSTNPSSTYNSIDADSGYPINYGTLDKSSITMAIFDDDINAVTCRGLFDGFENLLAIQDFENLKTGAVTQMYEMFKGCRKLDNIDLSGLNTESVTDMGSMFYECQELKSIDLSGLNTENVETIQEMFFGCSSLKAINFSGFKTPNIIITSGMFRGCSSLKILDLSSFDTENVTTMTSMFRDCTSLTTIIATDKFKTSSVVLDLGANMFTGCSNLVGCQGTGIDATTDERRARIDEAGNPGYFSSAPWMYWYLTDSDGDSTYETINYTSTKPTSGNYEIVTRRDQVVYNDLAKSDITNAVFDNNITPVTCESFFEGFTNLTKIDGLEKLTTDNVKSMKKMFYGCNNLKYLDLLGFNTSNVELMREMFKDCSSLITIISNDFDTTHLTAGEDADMFSGCANLVGCKGTAKNDSYINSSRARVDTSLNPGYFSTAPWMYWYLIDSDGDSTYETIKYTNSKPTSGEYGIVTRTDKVVYNGLTKGNITNAVFDIDVNADTCVQFFMEFTNLKEVQGIGKLKKGATKRLDGMFMNCSSLKNIDLRDFDVGNVQSINELFYGCSSLETVYLGEKVTIGYDEAGQWFYNCSSLTTIYVLNDNFSSLHTASNMFYNCTNLVGGAGTKYDPNWNNTDYAHIDGGTANPGYFTFYDPLNPPSPPSPPSPGPTPYYPSGGGSGGSSGSSGGSGGGGGGGGGGPITEEVPAVTYVPHPKISAGVVSNLASSWDYDISSLKWKLYMKALDGSELPAANGFYLFANITTQIVNGQTVYSTVNNEYYFDAEGNMVTGWVHTSDGKTYFFEHKKTPDEGKMIIGWKQIQGHWYCFGPDGSMYRETITPDGHPVGPDGKWLG